MTNESDRPPETREQALERMKRQFRDRGYQLHNLLLILIDKRNKADCDRRKYDALVGEGSRDYIVLACCRYGQVATYNEVITMLEALLPPELERAQQ